MTRTWSRVLMVALATMTLSHAASAQILSDDSAPKPPQPAPSAAPAAPPAAPSAAAPKPPAPASPAAGPPPVQAPVAPPPAPVAAPPAAPPAPVNDTVLLKDGTKVDGLILKQEPGQYVTIRTASGEERTLTWDRITEVIARAHPGAAVAAGANGPGTTTATTVHADQNGASFTKTVDCTGGPNDPQCHKDMGASMGPGGPKAGYHAEEDCAEHPESEICKSKTAVDVSKGGLTASYKVEHVKGVKTPPSSAVNFGIDFGGGGLLGGTVSAGFLSAALKVKILAGGQFPGAKGGGWSGVAIQPAISGLLLFAGGGGEDSSTTTLAGVQFGGTLGYQFLYFGTLNPKTLQQPGFGLLLGAYAGVTGIIIPGTAGGDSTSSWSPSYGPELGFSFPSYNAGTADYSAFNLTLLVLPTGDAGTLVSGSIGWLL